MKLTSWGAALNVTGSMHLLTTSDGSRILVDCGIDYSSRSRFLELNGNFPFDPSGIHAVILTHAHVDHCGNLPNLIKQGFEGPIYCTPATRELSYYLLEDSLKIQESEARKSISQFSKKGKKQKGNKQHKSYMLYTHKHLKKTIEQMVVYEFEQPFKLTHSVQCQFYKAGHILGAASAFIEETHLGRTQSIGFTGDLGKSNSTLMPDPTPLPKPDVLVCEATYGGRFHTDKQDPRDILLEHIQKTCVNLSGKLIIPAFSVGRTQAILFTLHQLYREGRLPNIKIYTDSPLAIKTTELYQLYPELLNAEAREFNQVQGDLFKFDPLHTLTDSKHSMYISAGYEPCVIVSAAGMAEGGRIQEHIRNNISNPYATILIAGFCAEGTLGHALLQGKSTLIINKKERSVMAQIKRTDVYSAHPDHAGLLQYITQSTGSNLRKLILVHAEPKNAEALLKDLKHLPAQVAQKGQEVALF